MHGQAFFMGWADAPEANKPPVALVFTGADWVPAGTEKESRARAKLFPHRQALDGLTRMRLRFGKLEIKVCPIWEWGKKDPQQMVKTADNKSTYATHH